MLSFWQPRRTHPGLTHTPLHCSPLGWKESFVFLFSVVSLNDDSKRDWRSANPTSVIPPVRGGGGEEEEKQGEMGRGLWLVWTPRRAVGVEGRKDCNSCVLVCILCVQAWWHMVTHAHTILQNLTRRLISLLKRDRSGPHTLCNPPPVSLPLLSTSRPVRPQSLHQMDGRAYSRKEYHQQIRGVLFRWAAERRETDA